KIITSAPDWGGGAYWVFDRGRFGRGSCFSRNTNRLMQVNNVWIGDVVIRGKSLPGAVIARCDAAKGITTGNRISLISTGAKGPGGCSHHMRFNAASYQNHS